MKDGHLNKYKVCTRVDAKEYRNNKLDYYQAYDRLRAKTQVRKDLMKRLSEKNKLQNNEHKRKSAAKLFKRKEATELVYNAVRSGKLKKLPCFICGKTKVQGHHPDYE